MARFRYRMENILNLQLKLEDQAKAAFGVANARLIEEQEILQEYIVRKATYERKVKDYALGIVDIKEINHYKNGVRAMEQAIADQMEAVKRAQRDVDLARLHLNEAMKDRKTQEILKEKAFEAFLEEVKAEENKVTDELISYKYGTAAKAGNEDES